MGGGRLGEVVAHGASTANSPRGNLRKLELSRKYVDSTIYPVQQICTITVDADENGETKLNIAKNRIKTKVRFNQS